MQKKITVNTVEKVLRLVQQDKETKRIKTNKQLTGTRHP